MPFDINQPVIRKGTNTELGRVIEGPIERRNQMWYRVQLGGRTIFCQEQDLLPYMAQDNLYDAFRHQVYGGYDSFIIKLTLSKIFQPVKNTLYSYNASRTELHGYQYKPLLKYLNSTTKRLLIADEVGLGKTIEAGYILQEERARRNIARALVVCPAALRIKWHNEMLDRFGINFDILDSRRAKRDLPKIPENPHSNYLYGIVSYDSIRSDTFRERLEAYPPELNILIVDEVHHCRNRETKNFKIIEVLAETSDAVLFLSATPIHTENKNLFNLLNLLVPDKFAVEEAFDRQLAVNKHIVMAERYLSMASPETVKLSLKELQELQKGVHDWDITQDPYYPVVLERLNSPRILSDREFLVRTQELLSGLNILSDTLTRTKKRDVHEESAVRSAYPLITPFTEYEKEVYRLLIQHIYLQYERHYNDQIARFVLCNFARQISSSLVSAVEYYQQIFRTPSQYNSELELDEWEDEIDEEELKNYRISEDEELRILVNSFSTERLREEDSKFKRLLSALEETTGKIIIFAFYKRSLRYLEERFSEMNISCIRIDGDVPSCPEDPERDERKIRIEKFRDDPAQKILLSSQVGSEGLDFQFCDTLVNWDLPWNPMVVEQRIGRIDRLGQKSEKIHIYNMVSKGSIEEYILEKLYMRINIFQESIGELEPILGPKISELTRDLLSPYLTEEEKIRKIEMSTQAVLREKEHMLNLEKKSVELIGHNEIIQQKLEKVSRLGRYISGEHLERFVSRFLEEYHPTSQLGDVEGNRPDINTRDVRILYIDHSLRTDMAANLNPYVEEEKRFRELLRKDKLKVTFYAETALRNPDAEMIHSRHPLVMKIADFYKLNNQQLQAVFRLKLTTSIINPGIYFWVWASIDETGVFTGRYLKPIFINLETGKYIEEEERAEELLYHLLMNGKDWDKETESLNLDTCNYLIQKSKDSFRDYVKEYRKKRILEAEAVITRQKQSIESTYTVLKERKAKAIETARIRQRPRNIINALTAQLEKLQNEFDMKIAEIESNRDLSLSYHLEGIGLVKINRE